MKILLIVVLLAVLPTMAQKSLRIERSVVGTWKLVKYVDTSEGGKAVYPWGEQPSGILMYDDTGHMAVQIQRTPIAKLSAGAEAKLKQADKERLLDAYTAYFGRYEVDWQKMTITHLVEGNLFPFYNGTAQLKGFELAGDCLTLIVKWDDNGQKMSGIRVFERLKAR